MKTIVVKTQKELDALPKSFNEYTVIEIRNADGNYIRVVALENSRVVARENSSVEAFDFSLITIFSACVVVKYLADYSVASIRGVEIKIEKKDDTATIVKTPESINHSFDTWLERGYIEADGIRKKLTSQKKINDITVYTVEEFLDKKESFVVRRGDLFSHGETVEKAIESLRYKISDRDTSKYKKWTIDSEISEIDAIQSYRAITGACEYGVKQFCESIEIPKNLTVKKVIELTKDQYGSNQYESFFKEK